MKRGIILILIAILLLAGCSQKQPDIICNSPYIRHADDCCLDMNRDQICDDDQSKSGFAEPTYAPSNDITNSHIDLEEEEEVFEAYEYQPDDSYEEPTPIPIEKKDLPEPIQPKPKVVYTTPEPELAGWEAENDIMSIKITKIVIDVNDIKPKDLISPDKEVYLKEIHLTITDKMYGQPYLNPELNFRVGDSFDPLIIRETLLCDASDDIKMEGCKNALPDTESMDIVMKVDRKIKRYDVDKDIWFALENRRDSKSENVLEIKKKYNILKIPGAVYI